MTNVLAAGVTNIHGIDFQTTEIKKYREQARELALKAAKEKAEKMAAVLGTIDRRPLQISESYLGGWGSNRMLANTIAEQRPRHARQFRRRFRHDRPRQALHSCQRQRDI